MIELPGVFHIDSPRELQGIHVEVLGVARAERANELIFKTIEYQFLWCLHPLTHPMGKFRLLEREHFEDHEIRIVVDVDALGNSTGKQTAGD